MGFFKKIFKPVSKVLDKIIPNEIKPALPYLAAFAPMFGPTSAMMGSGIMQRALLSGGMNIAGQLAQEGNEGDINLLSAGLGALSGAMTTPGGPGTYGPAGPPGSEQIFTPNKGAFQNLIDKGINRYGADSAMGEILGGAAKASKFMTDPGLMKYGIPAAQGTGDLMFAQAKRDQDEYDRMMEEEAEAEGASNAQRAAAIRQSMESYGFSEEEIEDAIYAAGYKTGGRVGIMNAKRGLVDGPGGYSGDWITKKSKNWITKKDKKINLDDIVSSALDDDEDEEDDGIEWIKKKDSSGSNKWIQKKANGGRVGFTKGGDVMKAVERGISLSEALDIYEEFKKIKEKYDYEMSFDNYLDGEMFSKGGRVGLRFGGIGDAVENIEDEEIKESAKFAMNDMDIPIMDLVEEFEITFKRKPNSLEELKQFYKDRYDYKGPGDVKMQEDIKEEVVMEAKDGGLMNLGGKEMDMRGGGFIPIGKKERADDVPARLSKNEFVMTADAVRAAGGGSVNEGAKRMYETMNKLEARA